MKKLFILIFVFLLLVQPTLAYTKLFDENTKTLSIINANSNTIFTIQQIETGSEICNDGLTCKEEDFNITSFRENDYIFSTDDLKINWQQFRGKNNITRAEFYVLTTTSWNETIYDYGLVQKNQTIPNITYYENVTDLWNTEPWQLSIGSINSLQKWNFSYTYLGNTTHNATVGLDFYQVITPSPLKVKIFWNETGIIGSHQETRYKDEWKQIQNLNGKIIKSGESYIIKIIFYKQAETGQIQLQTIPSFMGVEEDRMTWWNNSWNNSVHNTISNGSRPYQISLNVSNTTGTNNATYVYCNGKCNLNFTDIRFTLDNTTALPYWIENNVTGKVWVNVTGNGTVNMYYGNPDATTTSNGNNTFLLYDHFLGTTLDTTRWTATDGTPAVANSIVTLTTGGASWESITGNIRTDRPAIFQAYMTLAPVSGAARSSFFFIANTSKFAGFDLQSASGGQKIRGRNTSDTAWASSYTAGSYKTFLLKWSSTQVNVQEEYVDVTNSPITNIANIPPYNATLYFDSYGATTLVDYAFIRTYADTEPVWATWGAEQQEQQAEVITQIEFIDTFVI